MQKFNPEIILNVAVFSRGKPQKHSFAAICSDGSGKALVSVAKFGRVTGKTEAISAGIRWGLDQARRLQAEKIEIRVDDPSVLDHLKPNSEFEVLLRGFRFYRVVSLEAEHKVRGLAEKAQLGWRGILKK